MHGQRKEQAMPVYDIPYIEEAQRTAALLELRGWELFCRLRPEDVRRICNGIGAEWMPEAARELLDRRHRTLRVAAMIHDVQYHFGTGTDEDFTMANRNLRINGVALARHEHAWYSPVRYLVMHDAAKLAGICELFGRKAYDEAIAARKAARAGS